MKKFILLVVLAFCSLGAFAQTRISGTVKDTKGVPVIGAAVMLDGSTSVAAITDLDGKYVLTIPSSAKNPRLRVNMMSYVEKIVPVGDKAIIDIIIEEDTEQLEESVVVGYGSMRKSDLTGSVTSVKIDEGNAARSSSIDQLLQGHAAGVQVLSNSAAPDAGVSIRIRGVSSFNGSTEPLYVVDGIIINASQGGETLISKGEDNASSDEAINGLMGINPQDIASLEVLKDASATAIYGAQGANGVVLITTKSASKDRPSINFSSGIDISSVYQKQPLLNFDEYVDYLYAKQELGVGESVTTYLDRIYDDPVGRNGLKVTPIDWQDECLRTAIGQRYYFSIAGRPKSFSYLFSLSYSDKQGIVKETGVKQYTGRLNLDKTVGKRFKLGTKVGFSYVDSDMTQATGGGRMTAATSLIRSMVSFRPYTSVNQEDEDDDDINLMSSPDRWVNKTHFINMRKEYRVNPSFYLDYIIIPGLSFRSTIGGDYRNREQQKFKSSMINTTTEGSNGASGTYETFNWNWNNILTFNKKIKGHSINSTLGSEVSSYSSSVQNIQGWNIDQYKAGMQSLNAAPNTLISYTESASATMSLIFRTVYNYKDRYVLTASFRADGSSKFQGKNKWSYFPATAFAWRLSEEPWFNVPAISSAKVRLGWGRVGSQAISNYQTLSNFANGTISAHNTGNKAEYLVSIYPSNLANPNLKWETTEQTNIGLDLGLFRGRLTFTADVYDKMTYDLLQNKEIPTSSGFSTIAINEGTIRNRGLEFAVTSTPIKTRDFELSLNGNLTFNRNQIVTISETADTKSIWVTTDRQEDVVMFEGSQIGSANYVCQSANIFMEGYPMGLFYGYKTKGIVPVGGSGLPLANGGAPGEPGQFDYYDLNGNGFLDIDDRTIIVDPNPDFIYGFDLSMTYKNFSFSMNFTGSQGNDLLNTNFATQTDTYNSNRNIYRDAFYDAWTPENTDTIYPALGMIRAADYKLFSDFYVEDGSYLRLQSVSLGYLFNFKNNKLFRSLSLSASANNLYVWTKYRGWDPDVNSFGTNIRKMGVDSGSYPSSRSFSFDVKFTF